MFLACLHTHALPINTLPIGARLTPWLLGEVLRVKGDLHDFATPFMVFFVTDSFAGVCQWQTPVVKACYYFATHPRLTLAVFCLSAVVCVLSRSKPIIHTAYFVPSSVPALPGDGPQAVSDYDSIVFYLTNTNPCAIPVAIIILQACCLDVQFRIIVELLEFHNIISWVCS